MRILLVALGLVAASCAAPPARGDTAGVFVSEGGMVRPIANGARLALEHGGWATLSFTSFPPSAGTQLEVALDGVDEAQVFVTCEMAGMDHGALRRQAVASAHRHRAPLDLAMAGTYRVTVEVVGASARSTVVLVVAGG